MGGDQFIFPWDAVKVPTMIQKGAVQTTFFWCGFLVMGFLCVVLRKKSRNKTVKIKNYHMSQVILKDRWGICSHFSLGCCKSVRYDSKACCSNNMLFLMFLLHYSKVISYNVQSKFSHVSSRSVVRAKNIYHSSYCSALFLILPDAVEVSILSVWHWCKYLGIMEF